MPFRDKIRDTLEQSLPDLGLEDKKQILQNISSKYDDTSKADQSKRLAVEILSGPPLEDGQIVRNIDGKQYYLGKYLVERKYLEASGYYGLHVRNTAGEQFFLEIISLELLTDQGFGDSQEWQRYLQRLSAHGLIELADFHTTTNQKCVTVYSSAPEFKLVDETLYEDESLYNEQMTLRLVHYINEAHVLTERRGAKGGKIVDFSHITINPHSILVNPSGEIRFVAIGASLVARPQYFPSFKHSRKQYPQSLGFGAYTYFLGLLTFELLSKTCPIKKLEEFEQRFDYDNDRYLSNSSELDGYPQHFRAFLKRATHVKVSHRYGSAERVGKDLIHIAHYLDYRAEHVLEAHFSKLVELVDYLRLRLLAHVMNPSLKNATSPHKSGWLVRALYRDLEHFFSDESSREEFFCRILQEVDETKTPAWFDWVGPNGQTIYRHYQIWQQILDQWMSRPDAGDETEINVIGYALLSMILDEEIWCQAQCMIRYHYQVSKINVTLPAIEPSYAIKFLPTDPDDQRIDISFASQSMYLVNSALAYIRELQQEGNFAQFIQASSRFEDYSDLAFLMMVLTSSITIVDHYGTTVYSNRPANEQTAQEYYKLGIQILEFHHRIAHYYRSAQTTYVFPRDIDLTDWERFSTSLLDAIRTLTIANREIAELFPFNFKDRYVATNNKGTVSLKHDAQRFTVSAADFIREDYRQASLRDRLNVKVDLLPESCNMRIGTLLIMPFGNLPSLPDCVDDPSDNHTWSESLFLSIRKQFLPHFVTINERTAILYSALGENVFYKIKLEDDTETFTVNLIYRLRELEREFDSNLLIELLQYIREHKIGSDKDEIDELIIQLKDQE